MKCSLSQKYLNAYFHKQNINFDIKPKTKHKIFHWETSIFMVGAVVVNQLLLSATFGLACSIGKLLVLLLTSLLLK
jgi:hypothetical protein